MKHNIHNIIVTFLILLYSLDKTYSSSDHNNNDEFSSEADLDTNNFGYEERKRVIEKCTNKIDLIYNQNLKSKLKLDYNFIMNSCFIINPKQIKPNLKFFLNIMQFKETSDIFALLTRPNQIKSTIKDKITLQNKEQLMAIYDCKNVERLSSKYFIYKTKSLKENKEEEKKLYKLYKWLKSNGALFDKIDVYQDKATGARGLYALDDIAYNENVIFVPDKLVINCEKVATNTVSKKIRKYYDKMGLDYENIILALFIIEEMYNPSSFWKPYLNILPEDLSNFPLFFEDDELNLLKGHRIYNQTIKIRNRTRKYYEEIICPEAREEFQVDYCSVVSYNFFLWALVNVKSRVFGFSRQRFDIAGICPMSDLLNHTYDNPSLLWRFSGSYKGFLVYSFMNHNSRDEILTSYGHIGNEWLLLNYGFTIENNPHDEIHVQITLPTNDKYYYLKFILLEKRGLKSSKKMALSIDLESIKTINFFNIFRFMHYRDNINKYLDIHFSLQNKLPDNERPIYKNNKLALKVDYLHDNVKDNEEYNFNPFQFNVVDVNEEIFMLEQLKNVVKEHLNQFHSTLEEDEEVYYKNKHLMSFNIKNIFYYRISQKKILKFYIEFCDKMIPLYKMDYRQFRNYFKAHREELRPYDFYVEGSVRYLLSIYKN